MKNVTTTEFEIVLSVIQTVPASPKRNYSILSIIAWEKSLQSSPTFSASQGVLP